MHRPGLLLAGALIMAGGLGLGVFALTGHVLPPGIIGHLVAFLSAVLFLMMALIPQGKRRRRGVVMGGFLLLAVAGQLLLWWSGAPPPPGAAFALVLLLVGVGLLGVRERRRRKVKSTLEDTQVRVEAPRHQIVHTLPLDRVRDVQVERGFWGRLWGHGHLVARVKKGTMKDNIDEPLVAEGSGGDPLQGNGWDEEGRFHLKAAHPYKRVKAELEEQIRLARLPPREREEAALAHRLTQDLGELEV